jgi:hypothetical protein
MKIVFFLTISILFISCGVSKEEYNSALSRIEYLNAEMQKLNNELEQYKYGEERIIAFIKKSYTENDIKGAKMYIDTFKEYHPESIENSDFISLVNQVEKIEEEEKLRIARAEGEKATYEETTLFDLELWGRKSGAVQETKKFKAKVEFSHQAGTRMVFRDPDKITTGLFFVEKRFPEMAERQPVTIYFLAKRQGGLLLNSILHIIELEQEEIL